MFVEKQRQPSLTAVALTLTLTQAKHKQAVYLEELPEDLIHNNFKSSARVTFGFYAGGSAQQIGGEQGALVWSLGLFNHL
jgi:hypothetical protein